MTSTDKSVFTKALELALCCCSEIPVPAAAKAQSAPTRRPNEPELAAAPAVAPQPAELDAETVANLAAVRERRLKEARARREAERAAQTTLQLAAHLQKLVSLASARESEATELVTDNGGVVTAP